MRSPKLQRWTDVLVALLRHRFGATFADLAADVPAYRLPTRPTERQKATVKRMFERDKSELLAFGVPIETLGGGEEIERYRLRPADFYLPYLSVVQGVAGGRSPRRVDRDGYHSLRHLAFEADELAAIGAAAERAQRLGDPLLAEAARSGARKLAFDIPGLDAAGQDAVVVQADDLDPAIYPALDEALIARKRLSFTYHSMSGDVVRRRTVEPLGLFFLNGHWYLAAREPGAELVKNFRVSRMRNAVANAARPHTADFAVPPEFDLRRHARSRQAWELGDGDAIEAVVEFTARTGAASPWMEAGTAVPGQPAQRGFRVTSLERFVRWLLSLGGAARPVSPVELVDAFGQTVRDTLARYRPGT